MTIMIAWSGSRPIVSQRLKRVNSASSVNTLGGGGDILVWVYLAYFKKWVACVSYLKWY